MTVFLSLAVASISAQTQSAASSSTTYIETSKFIGKKVRSSQGDEIGTVKDIVLDRNTGCLAYTVVSTSGGGSTRGTTGGKMVAVPWAVYSPSNDINVFTVTVDRDRIYNAPAFDYAHVDEYSRPDYITNVYSYYGVSSGAAVGVGVSGSTSTTTSGATTATGATTTTGANTTPGAATSPAEGSPARNVNEEQRGHPGAGAAGARARETATPSPYGRAGSSPSKESTPSARQKPHHTPSSRSETDRNHNERSGSERSETGTRSETSPQGERGASEKATTGEKTKGSTRERSQSRERTSPPEQPEQ